MSDDFDREFDALISKADPDEFRNIEWLRQNGEAFDSAVHQIAQVIGARPEFELVPQSTQKTELKKFLLKTKTGKEIAFINITLASEELFIHASESPKGLSVRPNVPPVRAPLKEMSEARARQALGALAQHIG